MTKSLYVTVRDKKRPHIVRDITRRAYQMMTDRYELLNQPVQEIQKKSSVKPVEPVVKVETSEPSVEAEKPKKRGPKPKQEVNEG